jgi:hypothetical protein
MSQSLSTVAEEGASQAAPHNGNGLLPALPLSYGGGGQAAAASVTDPQQPSEGQQAPQQQDQAEQQAVSSAVSGSNAQLSTTTSVRGCCCALRAFWTDFQVHWHSICGWLYYWSSMCCAFNSTVDWAQYFAGNPPNVSTWPRAEPGSGVTQPRGLELLPNCAHVTAPTCLNWKRLTSMGCTAGLGGAASGARSRGRRPHARQHPQLRWVPNEHACA